MSDYAESVVVKYNYVIANKLPKVGKAGTIYMIPSSTRSSENSFILYNGDLKEIGRTSVDLSQYWSKSELTALTQEELEAILV